MGGVGNIVSGIVDSVTGGLVSIVRSIKDILKGDISGFIKNSIKGVIAVAFDPITSAIINVKVSELFESKYENITNVSAHTYNLIGEQTPSKPTQEFIDRAVIFEESFASSLKKQIFYGGAFKFMAYIRWCKRNDIHNQLGFNATSSAIFNTVGASDIIDKYQFAPVMCIRAWTVPVLKENYPDYWDILYASARRAFNDKNILEKLVKDIHQSPTANDIDFAYVFMGIAINRKERYCQRYIWEFFYWLLEYDPYIESTPYNTSFNGVDGEWYYNNGKYAEVNDKYYVKINETNNGKGITFIATPETNGNKMNVPFQWRISWSHLQYEANLTGKINTPTGISITGSKTGASMKYFNFNCNNLRVAWVINKIHHFDDNGTESTYDDESWDTYHIKAFFVVYRENFYIGNYYHAAHNGSPKTLDAEGETATYSSKNSPISISMLTSDYYQEDSGWFVLSNEQVQSLIQQGIIEKSAFAYLQEFTKGIIKKDYKGYDAELTYSKDFNIIDNNSEIVKDIYTVRNSRLNTPFVINASSTDSEVLSTWSRPVDISYSDGNTLYYAPLKRRGDNQLVTNISIPENSYNLTKIIYEDTLTLKELIPVNISNNIIISKQNINGTTFNRITVSDLFITNYCLNNFPVNYDAVDYVNYIDSDAEGTCPVIIPFNYQAFRHLSALDRNGSLQLMYNVLFNTFVVETIEIKWYQRKWFKVFVTVVQIVLIVIAVVANIIPGLGQAISMAAVTLATALEVLAHIVIQVIVRLIISILIKVIVTRIIIAMTGNKLLGEILGTIAAVAFNFVAGGYSSGSSGMLSMNNGMQGVGSSPFAFAKAALDAFNQVGNKVLTYKQNQFIDASSQFKAEVDYFQKRYDEVTAYNNELLDSLLNTEDSVYMAELQNKMANLARDPEMAGELMYLSIDMPSIIDIEQRYIYNFAEDNTKLPQLNSNIS